MRGLVRALVAIGAVAATAPAWAVSGSGTPDPSVKPQASEFDSLGGWHVKIQPLAELLRLGAERKSSMVGPDQSQIKLDILNLGIGLGVAFQPPWRYWRSSVKGSNGVITDKQYLGFSFFTMLRLGSISASGSTNILDNAELGIGLTLDFLEVISLGVGVDLYQGIRPDAGRRFDTGLIPQLFGAGQFTREDIFFTISFNFVSLIQRFGGSTNSGQP